MSKWLLIDANNACHRAYHALRGLEHGGIGTAVAYGFLRDLIALSRTHSTRKFAFCFDYGKGLRRKLFPGYKTNRREMSEEEADDRGEVNRQIRKLRDEYLPELGFTNVLYRRGYEADDVIAQVCLDLPSGDEAVIVSGDADLYQCLGPRVTIWHAHRKRIYTRETLAAEFHGISPEQWWCVKAIAGCSSDCIKGIDGIGEKTAAKWLRGMLKEGSVALKKILDNVKVAYRNAPLVRLPFQGIGEFPLKDDSLSRSSWRRLMRRLGADTLVGEWL